MHTKLTIVFFSRMASRGVTVLPSRSVDGRSIGTSTQIWNPNLATESKIGIIGRCTSFAKFLDPEVMFVHIFLPSWYLLNKIVDRCIIIFSNPESTFHMQKTSGKRSRDQGRDQGLLRADSTPRGWRKWTRKPKPPLLSQSPGETWKNAGYATYSSIQEWRRWPRAKYHPQRSPRIFWQSIGHGRVDFVPPCLFLFRTTSQ